MSELDSLERFVGLKIVETEQPRIRKANVLIFADFFATIFRVPGNRQTMGKVDSKGSASVFRIGGIFIGFMMVPMLHTALGSPVTSAEISGKYLLGMVIAGFIVDFFVVRRRG